MSDFKTKLDKANAKLEGLIRTHRDLDNEIKKEFDNFTNERIVKGLKRKKLRIKEEIADLETVIRITQ